MAPGHATNVINAVTSEPGALIYHGFALPKLKGEDTTNRSIFWANETLSSLGMCPPTTFPTNESAIDIEVLKLQAHNLKIEGWMLKNDHCREWYKLKPTRTVDAVVVDYSVSRSPTTFGDLKAIQVALEGKVIASVGTGFTPEYRATVDRKKLIGLVAEVEYDEVAANGKLKFPRFLRWRPDRDPESCKLEQIC